MAYVAGIDIGSTYTKAVVLRDDRAIMGRALRPTGFKLAAASEEALREACGNGAVARNDIAYIAVTGFGRHQAENADVQITDLTAAARGAAHLFPGTRTVLDVGGQTMKASKLDQQHKVHSFRLNDKCAAGTGAFLEKTARYMGYSLKEIGPLVATSHDAIPISGVCAVFAESEVINHLSQGVPPADIMHGAIVSLVGRSVQLMKRVRMEPEFTVIGGILRFSRMVDVIRRELADGVNVPDGDMVQFVPALGAGLLATRRAVRRNLQPA